MGHIETAPCSAVKMEFSRDGSVVSLKQDILTPFTILDHDMFQHFLALDGRYHAFSSTQQMSSEVMDTLPYLIPDSYSLRAALGGYFAPNLFRFENESFTTSEPRLRVYNCTVIAAMLEDNMPWGSAEQFTRARGSIGLQILAPPLDSLGKLLPGWSTRPVYPEDPKNPFFYVQYDSKRKLPRSWKNFNHPVSFIPQEQLIPVYAPTPRSASPRAPSHRNIPLPPTPRRSHTLPNDSTINKENAQLFNGHRVFYTRFSEEQEALERDLPKDRKDEYTGELPLDFTQDKTQQWVLNHVRTPAFSTANTTKGSDNTTDETDIVAGRFSDEAIFNWVLTQKPAVQPYDNSIDDDEGLYVSDIEERSRMLKSLDRQLFEWMLTQATDATNDKTEDSKKHEVRDVELGTVDAQQEPLADSLASTQPNSTPCPEFEPAPFEFNVENVQPAPYSPDHYRPSRPPPTLEISLDLPTSEPASPISSYTSASLPGVPPAKAIMSCNAEPKVRVCHSGTQAADQFGYAPFNADPSERHQVAPIRIGYELDEWYVAEDVWKWMRRNRKSNCVDGKWKTRADTQPLQPGHIWKIEDLSLAQNHDDASLGFYDSVFIPPPSIPMPERTFDPTYESTVHELEGHIVYATQYCKHYAVTCVRETNSSPAVPFIPDEFYILPDSSVRDAISDSNFTSTSLAVIQGFAQRAHDARVLARNDEALIQRMKEFDKEEASERLIPKHIPPNYRNITQTAIGRSTQKFFFEGIISFMWFSLQELIPVDNNYFLKQGRLDAMMLVCYATQIAFKQLQKTMHALGLTEDVEHVMMRPGHYYQLQLMTNPLFSEGQVNFMNASIFLLKKFGRYQLTDVIEGLMLFTLPNPGLINSSCWNYT
jgi:hypothetical protein